MTEHWYVNTHDSHESIGPFDTLDEAFTWASQPSFMPSFSVDRKADYTHSVRKPWERA